MWFWLMKCNYQKRLVKAAYLTYAFSFVPTSMINASADIPRKNLTDYEMWLLPLWCYAVGPIHSRRPCKYYDNPCEYHEVNNPMLLFNNLPMITMANCVKTTFAELSSHFLPLWDSLHYCFFTCFCFTLYIPLLQIRIIPAPVHSTLAPATKDGSSKEWWMIPINQLSSLFSERGFCEQMFPT